MAEIRNTDELLDLIKSLNTFKWDLIFFKKTGSNNNIFTCYEVKIDKKSFDEYINSLIKEETFILENSIESVDEYNGDNPITSCIKIYKNEPIIKDILQNFIHATDRSNWERKKEIPMDKKTKGYALIGNNNYNQIILICQGNPMVNVKGFSFERHDNNNDILSLNKFGKAIYNLQLYIDCFIYDGYIYGLNFKKTQSIFNIQRFIYTKKQECINKIISSELFPINIAESTIRSHFSIKKASKFLNFCDERLNNLNENTQKRIEVCSLLGISCNNDNKLIIEGKLTAEKLVDYLCKCSVIDIEDINQNKKPLSASNIHSYEES